MTARTRPAHTEQPMPIPNGHPSIQSLVRADLDTREQVGVERYGTSLQPNNGRDALRDAYEEALDLTLYIRQVIEEQRLAVEARRRPPSHDEPLPRVADDPDTYDTVAEHHVSWDLDDAVKVSFGPEHPEAGDDEWEVYLGLSVDALTRSNTSLPDGDYRYLHRAATRDQVRLLAFQLLAMTDGGAAGDWRGLADQTKGRPGRLLRDYRDRLGLP